MTIDSGRATSGNQERLRAAPQSVYTDAALLDEEQAAIFDRDWVFIARAGAVPDAGDYLTAKVGRRPVFIVRQKDGSIRAFANFCLHRYARLLDGCGSAKRIVCPYHSWTYDMSGALIGVSEREGFADVDKADLGLQELSCEVWLGFVFVSRNRDLEPVASRLGALADHLVHYDLSACEDRYAFHEEVWAGNWKLVFENFVECYHVTHAHKRSIGPTNPTSLAEQGPQNHDHFSVHYNPYGPDDMPEIHNQDLDENERSYLHVIGVYPNLLVAVDPNFVWWMMLEPEAIDRTNSHWGLSFSPLAMRGMKDPDGYAEAVRETIAIATEEDKDIVARVQDGAAFGASEPGFLHSSLEVYVKEFRSYLDRMLGG